MSGKLLFAAQPPIVGVVEEPQCYRERKLERYVARIMFIKKGKEWEAVQPKYFRTPGEIVSTK